MGRRGPKPMSAAVKEAQGNPGRRPIGADPVGSSAPAPSAAVSSVPAPPWLKKEGLKIWDRLAPRLVLMRLLGPADAEAFARYCRSYARWHKMVKIIDAEGETYESQSAHGNLKRVHPAFLIADRLERSLFAVEDRFGLNPAERQRIYAARAQGGAAQDRDWFGGKQQPDAAATAADQSAPAHPQTDEQDADKSPVGFLN